MNIYTVLYFIHTYAYALNTEQVTRVVYYFVFQCINSIERFLSLAVFEMAVFRARARRGEVDKGEDRKNPWPHFRNACA